MAIRASAGWLGAVAVALSGCGADVRAPGGPTVTIEVRGDGLVYEAGADDPYSGEVVYLDDDFDRAREERYADGVASGTWREWWPGGRRLKAESDWRDGSQTGVRMWYRDGSRKEDTEMKDGVARGWVRMWWPDGRLRRQVYLEDGLSLHGHLLEYAEDGTVLWDAIFEHGEYRSGTAPPNELAAMLSGRP